MEERKYQLFVKLLEVLRENAETDVEATREMIKNNYGDLFIHEAMMKFKGKEIAYSDVLKLLKDEKFFYKIIDDYSIRG